MLSTSDRERLASSLELAAMEVRNNDLDYAAATIFSIAQKLSRILAEQETPNISITEEN